MLTGVQTPPVMVSSFAFISIIQAVCLSSTTLVQTQFKPCMRMAHLRPPNNSTIYRSTLDSDGIFRLYSHAYDASDDCNVSTLWEAFRDHCDVITFCACINIYCTLNDSQAYCLCLPGTEFVDPNDWSLGCERNFSEAVCERGKENEALYRIQTMDNLTWGDRPYFQAPMSTKEECSRSCLEDCGCGAALFENKSCKKQSLLLRYLRIKEEETMAIFKVGITSLKSSSETDNQKKAIRQIRLVTLGFTALTCVALAISGLFVFKSRFLRYPMQLENGNLGLNEEVTLRLFSYNELRRATNGFKEELGKGSFGAVYKLRSTIQREKTCCCKETRETN
jgi:hypothetical protein